MLKNRKGKQKGVLFYRLGLQKFNVKNDNIAPLRLKIKVFYEMLLFNGF